MAETPVMRPRLPATPPPRLVAFALYLWQGKSAQEACRLAGYKRVSSSTDLYDRAKEYGLLPDPAHLVQATAAAEENALKVIQDVLAPKAADVAEVLVTRALMGQPWAVRLFFERLGGQQRGATFDGNTPGEVVIRWGPGPGSGG